MLLHIDFNKISTDIMHFFLIQLDESEPIKKSTKH